MRTKILFSSLIIVIFTLLNTLSHAGPIQDIGQKIDDASITTSIYARYSGDPLLNPLKIKISTQDGIVKLSGRVETKIQYEKAIVIAQSTDGVNKVNASDLKIKGSNSALNDSFITAQVKGLLLKEKIFGDADVSVWSVNVETKNGVVVITGDVDNEEQKSNIIKIVQSVDGVKSVRNDLKVKA